MPKTQSVAWPDDLYKRINDKKDADACSFSDVVRVATELYLGFDPLFIEAISQLCNRHRLPPELIIQNMLIKRFAFEAAEDDFYGGELHREFPEFRHTKDGVQTGQALYDYLKDKRIKELERKKRKK